jgi:hypothetical protein
MRKRPQFVKASLLQSAALSVVLGCGVGKHAQRGPPTEEVPNCQLLRRGTEPAAANVGFRKENVELPIDQVRIRGEAPRPPVEATHRSSVSDESDHIVFSRLLMEEQLTKLGGTHLWDPLVWALSNGIESPADKEVNVRLRCGLQDDPVVLKFLSCAHMMSLTGPAQRAVDGSV